MPFELNIRISSFLIWIKGEINKQFGKEVYCGVLYYYFFTVITRKKYCIVVKLLESW